MYFQNLFNIEVIIFCHPNYRSLSFSLLELFFVTFYQSNYVGFILCHLQDPSNEIFCRDPVMYLACQIFKGSFVISSSQSTSHLNHYIWIVRGLKITNSDMPNSVFQKFEFCSSLKILFQLPQNSTDKTKEFFINLFKTIKVL